MRVSRGAGAPWLLPGLIFAQLLGVSLWFVSSAVLPSLSADWGLRPSDGGLLVSAVQVGFITGTLLFALTNLPDLFSPSRVFLASVLTGSAANLLFAYTADGLPAALVFRFITGMTMAGVYPVGMKIIVSYTPGRSGNALGWLLGAFCLGTAMPFLLVFLGTGLHWRTVTAGASVLALISGLLVIVIGDGPALPRGARPDFRKMFELFRIPAFRASALGYFGHSWEIYSLWVISPLLVRAPLAKAGFEGPAWVALGVFLVIGLASLGSIAGGLLSRRVGSLRVAEVSLAVSAGFCLLSPFLYSLHAVFYLPLLVLWSIFAVADSAQYSAMSALACPPEYVGTGLTIQNCIGFAITVVSIELTYRAWEMLGPYVGWLMAPGPLLGLFFLTRGGGKTAPARG